MENSIDKILSVFSFYIHEDLLTEEIKACLLKGSYYDIKKLKKYNQLLLSINWFVKKVCRYEIYFKEFYSKSPNIKNYEELEHHIHAYLEDIATVKNKLSEYMGALKNDINQVAINKEEIKKLFIFLDKEIHKTFEKPLSLRRNHRHNGYRFTDSNLLNTEIADNMLSNNIIRTNLTEYAIAKFSNQRSDSFEESKSFWVENAIKNKTQVLGAANETVFRTKPFLYILLDIKTERIDNWMNKE